MDTVLVLLVALMLDLALGEPPRRLHPVVWMGKLYSLLEQRAPSAGPWLQFLYGTGIVVLVAAVFGLPAYFLLSYLRHISTPGYIFAGGLLLKTCFSFRELAMAAQRVNQALVKQKLDSARAELSALVRRETSQLGEPLLASAVVESLAENIVDSFIAPLFYFLLLGVPGALVYRVANTGDSMLGYHGKYEYLGKFAARSDDVLNFVPARIGALLIVLAAFIWRHDGARAWRTMVREHAHTESPNAGWPMSAAAGALNVKLEKVGYYQLGEGGQSPTADSINLAIRLVGAAAALWLVICLVIPGIGHVASS